MRELWRQIAARFPHIQTAVAVTDLQTGETAGLNRDVIHHPGCTLNVLVLMCVLRDVQAGRYPLQEVEAQVENTIRHSSAERARALLVRTGEGDVVAGVKKVNALAAELGMHDTMYDHPPAYWWRDSVYGLPNVTTASDLARAAAGLWRGEVLDGEHTAVLLDKLTLVKPGLNHLIPRGIPAGADARVGHKNGFFRDPIDRYVDNDVGLVWQGDAPGGRAYAIALLFQGVPEPYSETVWLAQRL